MNCGRRLYVKKRSTTKFTKVIGIVDGGQSFPWRLHFPRRSEHVVFAGMSVDERELTYVDDASCTVIVPEISALPVFHVCPTHDVVVMQRYDD